MGRTTTTKRSTTGTFTLLNGCLVNFTSNKQKRVALSSTESELMGMTEAAREVQFFRHLLGEFCEVEKPSRIHSDSEGAGFLAGNENNSTQTRHIGIRHFYVRELVEDGQISIGHVPGIENVANMVTKHLYRITLWEFTMYVMDKPE